MKSSITVAVAARRWALLLGLGLTAVAVSAQSVVELSDQQLPDATQVRDGLFPEDACKELEAASFKCMGFKPAVRFSLPANTFKLGSAELPEMLRRQLDVFAEVLGGKKGSGRVIRVEGHADASGAAEANQVLSQRRADAVRRYLIDKGAEPAMLEAVGLGTRAPKDGADPFAAVNRRVEIGRQPAKP
jgi:OOP family OmpA-OmpF porin